MFWHRKCAACAAKDQTIALLADVVDYHRQKELSLAAGIERPVAHAPLPESLERALAAAQATQATGPQLRPVTEDPLWKSEEEEDIEALLEAGSIGDEEAVRRLAELQAQNTQIRLVH